METESKLIEVYESFLNGNISSSMDEYSKFTKDEKAELLEHIVETYGTEEAVKFVIKYMRISA